MLEHGQSVQGPSTMTGVEKTSHWSLVGATLSSPCAFLSAFRSAFRQSLHSLTLLFLLSFSAPLGQRWQCWHSLPNSQPDAFQKKPHGLHVPASWSSAPRDSSGCRSSSEDTTSTAHGP